MLINKNISQYKWQLVLVAMFFFSSVNGSEATKTVGHKYVSTLQGSSLRTDILNSIREQVTKAYASKIKFVVRGLETDGNFAVLLVIPINENGKNLVPINKKLSSWVYAIAKRVEGKWIAAEIEMEKEYEILDVWKKKYPNIPAEIFEVVAMGANAEVKECEVNGVLEAC